MMDPDPADRNTFITGYTLNVVSNQSQQVNKQSPLETQTAVPIVASTSEMVEMVDGKIILYQSVT